MKQTARSAAKQGTAAKRSQRLPIKRENDWLDDEEQSTPHVLPTPRTTVPGIDVVDELVELEDKKARPCSSAGIRPRRKIAKYGTPLAAAIPSIRALSRPTAMDAEAARQDMAKAAQQLLQDPMRHLTQLEKLLGLARATDSQVRCLAMLTLRAVFKDLLPAYRIHSKTREELPHKVTKGVEQLQHYENVLLQAYHSYLKLLFHVTERAAFDTGLVPESRLAVKCMAGLLQAAPHFNYRSDLLTALVDCLRHGDPSIRNTASKALATILSSTDDTDYQVALEIVQLIADLVRQHSCVAPPMVLDCLMHLQFTQTPAQFPIATGNMSKSGTKHNKRYAATHPQQDGKELAGSEQGHAHTAVLTALFEVVFRVIKHCTTSKHVQQANELPLSSGFCSKKFPLLVPALHLLTKFGHLISVEYIQSNISLLRILISRRALPLEENLAVVLAALNLAKSQAALAMEAGNDWIFDGLLVLLEQLVLMPIVVVDKEGHSPSPPGQKLAPELVVDTANLLQKGCLAIPSVLDALLTIERPANTALQVGRCKQLLMMALSVGNSGLALALLCYIQRIIRQSRDLQAMLHHEATGPPTRPLSLGGPFAHTGRLTGTQWELSLLANHYHPLISAACSQIAAGAPADCLPSCTPGNVTQLVQWFSTALGSFQPPPRVSCFS